MTELATQNSHLTIYMIAAGEGVGATAQFVIDKGGLDRCPH